MITQFVNRYFRDFSASSQYSLFTVQIVVFAFIQTLFVPLIPEAFGQKRQEGINMIPNGNFENGLQGFFSELDYTEHTLEPGHFTLTRKMTIPDCQYSIPGDRTNGKGFYLITRGARHKKLWKSYVQVRSQTRYRFRIHFCHLPVSENLSETGAVAEERFSSFRVFINRVEVSSVIYDQRNHLAWLENTVDWYSGPTSGLVELSVQSDSRHYLALDDASMIVIDSLPGIRSIVDSVHVVREIKIALPFVRFEIGSDCLLPESFEALDSLADWLRLNSDKRVRLEGHTDALGDPENLRKLSITRVKQVKSYLVSRGIEENRISMYGFGGSRPVVDNSDEKLRHLNRRVELILF